MADIIHNDVVIKTESDIQITSNIVLSEGNEIKTFSYFLQVDLSAWFFITKS